MSPLVLALLLSGTGVSLSDRPTRVQFLTRPELLTEKARLTADVPRLGGIGGPAVQIGIGVGLMAIGGSLLGYGFADIAGHDYTTLAWLIGVIAGPILLGVGAVIVIIGIVRTLSVISKRRAHAERIEEIERVLERDAPPDGMVGVLSF